MTDNNENKVLKSSIEREQNELACSAEREKIKGSKNLNVPPLRFPEFTEEWQKCIIKDYGEVVTGNTPPTNNAEYYNNGSYLWASPADLGMNKMIVDTKTKLSLGGFKKTRAIPKGGILVTCIGSTIGKMGMAVETMSSNQQINSIIVNEKSNNDFVYYAISCAFPRYLSEVGVQAVPILSKSNFEKLPNYTTSRKEQNKIGYFLNLLDERIATQNKIIEDLKKLKSAIRKMIFTSLKNEHTENCEINQLLAYEQPSEYIVTNDEYSADTTLTPVLTANKGFVLGYTNENFGIYKKGECIIFDDFTMDAKYVSFPFKVKSSAIKILTAKTNVNLRFMFEYLSYLELKSEEHKRHYISEIASLIIELPSKEKQNRIAYLMTSLDNKLVLKENIMARYIDEKQYINLKPSVRHSNLSLPIHI